MSLELVLEFAALVKFGDVNTTRLFLNQLSATDVADLRLAFRGVFSVNGGGLTCPLLTAIDAKDFAMLYFLMSTAHFPLAESWSSDGQHCVHLACINGSLGILDFLLSEMESMASLRTRNTGATPLTLAALCGHLSLVKLLVEKYRVDVDQSDWSGSTALHHAAGYAHVELLEYLLQNGADVNAKRLPKRVPLPTIVSSTLPLTLTSDSSLTISHSRIDDTSSDCLMLSDSMLFAMDDNSDCEKTGLFGLDVDEMENTSENHQIKKEEKDKKDKGTAEMSRQQKSVGEAAICQRQTTTVAETSNAMEVDPENGDCDGFTPLMVACTHNRVDSILPLIRGGADVDDGCSEMESSAFGVSRATAAMLAMDNRNYDCLSYLIILGADVTFTPDSHSLPSVATRARFSSQLLECVQMAMHNFDAFVNGVLQPEMDRVMCARYGAPKVVSELICEMAYPKVWHPPADCLTTLSSSRKRPLYEIYS